MKFVAVLPAEMRMYEWGKIKKKKQVGNGRIYVLGRGRERLR